MSHALLVVDAQNEFSADGQRPVPNYREALAAIADHVARARREGQPIAWVRHHNRAHESAAFVPGSWGAALAPGFGPQPESPLETLFEKDVFGAFTTTGLDAWLRARDVHAVLIVGFYAHMCLATSAREALVRGFEVYLDPAATGARAIDHPVLGHQTADEVHRSALLHLTNMGAVTVPATPARREPVEAMHAQPRA